MTISTNKKYIIATIKSWNIDNAKRFISRNPDLKIRLITNKNGLTYQKIKKFNPRYIFLPHWSWIIPERIYSNYKCIVFHMTDLPFGRGGSPLQNLIDRGISKTKITALRVEKTIDSGLIYLKRKLELNGSAEQIFKRASHIIFKNMIPYIIKNEPDPAPQYGKVIKFKRRTPKQGDIANLSNEKKVYDYIRMLDAEGYPPAFIETSKLKIEFFNAKFGKNNILAKAEIRVKK
ncbi:MAG: methionyl-tRNA formyltransferase [Candidatus Omnitrophica bacterium]|nr:methionyl-tRNA formyltransferase [Candidatus Omnitrophota bacterium]MDD5352392.1 methionyl-tRNA formyltransferase [Candidatus Omnitrophota bacterium]MDD5549990.1 methionyl-tRNA formyltransferase [Candidatus Omnitrophota bacterium]